MIRCHRKSALVLMMLALCCAPPREARSADDPHEAFSLFQLREMFQHKLHGLSPVNYPPFVLESDTPAYGGMYGIDVSHWETDCDGCPRCILNWTVAAQEQVKFAYVKATTGASPRAPDAAFSKYWSDLETLHRTGKLYRGAFHWLTSDPSESGADQAKNFLNVVNVEDPQMPPALDFEEDPVYRTKDYFNSHPDSCSAASTKDGGEVYVCDGWVDVPKADIVAKIKSWLGAVSGHSVRKPIIYTRTNFWTDTLGGDGANLVQPYAVWLAQYPNNHPQWHDSHKDNSWSMPDLPKNASYPPGKTGDTYAAGHFWQFTKSGNLKAPIVSCSGVAAVAQDIDVDWFPSSDTDFKKSFGVGSGN